MSAKSVLHPKATRCAQKKDSSLPHKFVEQLCNCRLYDNMFWQILLSFSIFIVKFSFYIFCDFYYILIFSSCKSYQSMMALSLQACLLFCIGNSKGIFDTKRDACLKHASQIHSLFILPKDTHQYPLRPPCLHPLQELR